MKRYNPKEIEGKWQNTWDETGTYTANLQSDKPKYIAMSMFNYPSGNLHIGHAMNFTISDVKARFKRQQGFESYHPVGWDSFGLPAENRAIKEGMSPQQSMAQLIPDYHKAYKAMGWSNDWEKEIATHLPEYYKWSQWIFSEMHRNGLAYQDSRMQWWCELDNSVLANEQVIDGKCWRHDGPDDPLVQKKEVKQWFFKITDYADELLESIEGLDWTESVKLAQKNWIGKSEGAEIDFWVDDGTGSPKIYTEAEWDVLSEKQKRKDKHVRVFTTRADTLFGVTFMVLAPEHDLVASITTPQQKDIVETYIRDTQKKSELERQTQKEKTGAFTGAYAVNPASGVQVPIWIADYVLAGYGTGAIMAVPAHDERDYEFAKKFDLPITPVVSPIFNEHNPQAELRQTVLGIARDPKTDKYCMIRWKSDPEKHHKTGLDWPGGGLDENEVVEDGALREFIEETGYSDVQVVETLPAAVSQYWNRQEAGRSIPKWSVKSIVKLEVKSLAQGMVGSDVYEKNSYDVEWLSKDEILGSDLEPSTRAVAEFVFDIPVFSPHEGVMINSGDYDNLLTDDAREQIVADLQELGLAKEKINYKMRDWSVSRQRYWGAPIPIINCAKCGPVLVPDDQLPVVLPELEDFKPSGDGRSALARATDWLKVDCPECGGDAERETDTLDTYIDSSWYMYRYFDPRNQEKIFDSKIVKKWEPIDFYNGADHATAHLLYARFIGHFFKTIGLVDEPEPFKQFLFNGKVTAADGTMFSKSKGTGVDPLEIIEQGYGADALRMFVMFAAPLDTWAKWDPQGVPATHRFISRLWNLVQEYLEADEKPVTDAQHKELLRVTHQMIKKVTLDLEENRYNTAIAASMEALNHLYKLKAQDLGQNAEWQGALEAMIACVAPFAPHASEQLWFDLGHHTTVHIDTWPEFDEQYLATDTITVAVQVNGKLRGEIEVAADVSEADAIATAQTNDKVRAHTAGHEVVKTIYIPGKIVNIVVR